MDIAYRIEATLLRPDHIENDIRLLCMAAKEYVFAAVLVPPVWARFAVTAVANSPVRVSVPVGYPMGTHTASVKGLEARLALEEGAAEVTLVPNLSAYKTGYREVFGQDVGYVLKQADLASPDALVKVLVYLDLLSLAEQREVVRIVQSKQARFLMLARYDRQPIDPSAVRRLSGFIDPGVQLGLMGELRSLEQVRPFLNLGLTRLATPYAVDLVKQTKGTA